MCFFLKKSATTGTWAQAMASMSRFDCARIGVNSVQHRTQARIRKGQIEKQPADDSAFEAALSAFGRAHQLNTETSAWLSLQHRADVMSAWPPGRARARRS